MITNASVKSEPSLVKEICNSRCIIVNQSLTDRPALRRNEGGDGISADFAETVAVHLHVGNDEVNSIATALAALVEAASTEAVESLDILGELEAEHTLLGRWTVGKAETAINTVG